MLNVKESITEVQGYGSKLARAFGGFKAIICEPHIPRSTLRRALHTVNLTTIFRASKGNARASHPLLQFSETLARAQCNPNMAQQKIFKSRISAKDLMKFSNNNNNNSAVKGSPRWQYYNASQRITIRHDPTCFDEFLFSSDNNHVTRVHVNSKLCNEKAKSLSDLRMLQQVLAYFGLNYLPLGNANLFGPTIGTKFASTSEKGCKSAIKAAKN